MQDLHQKLESAAAKLIDALNLGFAVQKGLSSGIKQLPSVTVIATGGQESPVGSGNFFVGLSIECRTNANDLNIDEHREFCEEALAPMMSDSLNVELTEAVAGFIAFGVINRQSRQIVEDSAWVTELSMDVPCCNGGN